MRNTILVMALLACIIQPLSACSVFTVTDGSSTFFGNNEDQTNSYSVVAFVPAAKGSYGYFYMETPHDPASATPSGEPPMIEHYPQGGMNDQGLAYDVTATSLKGSRQMKFSPEQKISDLEDEHQGYILRRVLAQAATVEEAVKIIKEYRVPDFFTIQVLLADKGGRSAILGIGKDDRLSVIRSSGNYQVLTNFSQADPQNSIIFDPRFDIANAMLKEDPSVNIGNFLSILAAVHVEGVAATVYSNIYDLNGGDIYFYYFHNYQEPVKVNLAAELKKGKHSFVLSSLFKRKIFAQTATEEMVKTFSGLIKRVEDCGVKAPPSR